MPAYWFEGPGDFPRKRALKKDLEALRKLSSATSRFRLWSCGAGPALCLLSYFPGLVTEI